MSKHNQTSHASLTQQQLVELRVHCLKMVIDTAIPPLVAAIRANYPVSRFLTVENIAKDADKFMDYCLSGKIDTPAPAPTDTTTDE